MKTITVTIVLDEPTADFVHAAANMTGCGSVENAIEAMIIATRSRMRESKFVKKSVDELLDAVLPAFRSELHQRLVRLDPPVPPAPDLKPIGAAERRVIAALLNMAADQFANHGCTDFDLEHLVPNLADRRAIMHEWEERDHDMEDTYENVDNWILMRHFANKLRTP